jgi:cell division protease FtsH
LKKYFKSATIYIIAVIVILVLFTSNYHMSSTKEIPNYSTALRQLDAGNVKSVEIDERSFTFEFKKSVNDSKKLDVYIPVYSADLINKINKLAVAKKNPIKVNTKEPSNLSIWIQIIPTILILGSLILFYVIFIQQAQGGGGGGKVMNFGKSRAKLNLDDKNKVTFDDVAGADEEKEELKEVVDFLKFPKKYTLLGARIPKGIMLYGPPGTGKTLLAKAVAGEANVPFFSISGSDFVEMFVGVGASRVRDLFDQAKKNAPSIVFIDEIDAVGRHRGAGMGGGHDEREQTLNQLLVEMDGFANNEGVIVIAATNRPDILDPALLRPGRFDRQITVGAPDIKGREEILKVHVKKKPLDAEVDLSVIAKTTAGFTGADLENLTNEAALLAARKNKTKINNEDLANAMIKVIAGPEKKSRVISEKDKRLVSYHEAGHAILQRLLPGQDPVHQVSIIPRGRAGGYTLSLPTEDKSYVSKQDMIFDIITLLGGRLSEKIIIGDISTGASNDIQRATALAKNMVMKYGMSDKVGPMTFGGQEEIFIGRDFSHSKDYSEETASEIDREIKAIIKECYDKAEVMLKENIEKLHIVAQALLKKEKLEADEFEAVFMGQELPEKKEEPKIESASSINEDAKAIESEKKSEDENKA